MLKKLHLISVRSVRFPYREKTHMAQIIQMKKSVTKGEWQRIGRFI